MTLYQALDPNVEVLGQSFLATFDAISDWPGMRDLLQRIYARYGLSSIELHEWYPQQMVLDVFRDISITLGTGTLYKIGKQIPQSAAFPPQIATIEDAMRSIDVAYQMNHRGGKIGRYAVSEVLPQEITLLCENPYPCDFDQGIITALAREFSPPGTKISLRHARGTPCRKQGHAACTFVVRWR